MKMVEVRNLEKKYQNDEGVDQLSFSLYAGEIVALLGPNGAGKTTTIRCLTGLHKPDNGYIRIGGQYKPGDTKMQQMVSLIPDQPHLYPTLTIAEHLQFRARAFKINKKSLQEKVLAALQEVKLREKADQLTGHLSRGQKQRVILAGAIVQNASIYMLDEPTAGLDIPSKKWLAEWLIGKAKLGCAALVSTHSLDFVLETAHRVLLIREGCLICEMSVPHNQEEYSDWKQEVIRLLGEWSDD
ncbi:ABC transporter ATP-binding protein [Bacillus sp. WMMC1349]|uniref:ABC transporter ATP-binding protein n=1 Tax=Bacillus sp. WMMC1349 TaxID=2736254 RepID=UPI001555659C|nr:ABC transporter ATP-binding protein [Bacillus sp. WMMC1349]NPC91389.1 ABC transporter ATP-binding protein [Bacillus sp. WMMC1349]